MLKIIHERLRQGHRTGKYPKVDPVLPERFRGRPEIDPGRCPQGCRECEKACPLGAVRVGSGPVLDLGLCNLLRRLCHRLPARSPALRPRLATGRPQPRCACGPMGAQTVWRER